ncbi:MAG: hypothetical protein V4712_05680 [Pseudomonadota bacterium]
MNPIPFLALAAVASAYGVATDRLNQKFDTMPQPVLTSYAAQASGDLAVYDVLSHGAEPLEQPLCQGNLELAATLTNDFAEMPVAQTLTEDGLAMQLWSSTLMGTWTLVHKGDDGMSCIVSSGTGWTTQSSPEDVFDAEILAS